MAISTAGMRTSFLSLLSVAILATLLVASPAGASYYEYGVSLTGEIVRDSVPYTLNIKVVETMGGEGRLDVSLSALQDPAGPARVFQTQKWSIHLGSDEFSFAENTYRVDAGNEDVSFHADFLVERRQDASCGDDQQLFVTVPQGGGLRLETGNDVFGTVTEIPGCGESYGFGSGEILGPPPCPPRGDQVWAQALHVKERPLSDIARILSTQSRSLDHIAGRSGTWFFELKGSVPASRFRLNDRLSGTFEGTGLPWLDGTARFRPDSPLQEGQWFDCKRKREAKSATRYGALTGDLTVDVIGADRLRVNDPRATAIRSKVRSR